MLFYEQTSHTMRIKWDWILSREVTSEPHIPNFDRYSKLNDCSHLFTHNPLTESYGY